MSDAIIVACVTGGISLIGTIFTAVFSVGRDRKQKKSSRMAFIEQGVQSLLRYDLIRAHDKYTDRGYCPVYVRDVLEIEYQAYKGLDGNGTITQLYGQIMALPTEPPDNPDSGG